jgi:hypothetical protein
MPFGRKAKPCRVYEYGCLPPTSGQEELREALRLRNRYWNKLVEIDRPIRQESLLTLLLPGDIEAAHLEVHISQMREELKKERQKTRTGQTDAKLKLKIKAAKAELRALWEQNKKDRKPLTEKNREKLNALEAQWIAARKAARADSGLYWCNYGDVEAAYDAARKAAIKKWSFTGYHKADGTGKLTVRWQNGLDVAAVFDCTSPLLQIAPVHSDAWEHPVRAVRRKAARTTVRFRVRTEGRSPVWVELPLILHRPLPAGGEIRSASLICEQVAGKATYKLVVTVAPPAHTLPKEGVHRGVRPMVGINLGWRKIDGGVRVAYWVDEDGRHGELLLNDRDIIAPFFKLNDLQSIRDNYFNEAKATLSQFMIENQPPEWLKTSAAHLDKWRSRKRLLSFLDEWRDRRFAGDENVYEALSFWKKRELHLYHWQANLRDQVRRRRREIYRIFAARLTRDYSQVFIDDFDLAKIKKKKPPEDGAYLTTDADTLRTVVSPGILRSQIENACKREGVIFTKLDPKHITQECHACGWQEKWNSSSNIRRECPACKADWDQDYNAARLLLQRGAQCPAQGLYD